MWGTIGGLAAFVWSPSALCSGAGVPFAPNATVPAKNSAQRAKGKVKEAAGKATGYAAVRNSFNQPNMYSKQWYGNHPGAWSAFPILRHLARAGPPEELGSFIASEKARWAKVVKDNGIKAD